MTSLSIELLRRSHEYTIRDALDSEHGPLLPRKCNSPAHSDRSGQRAARTSDCSAAGMSAIADHAVAAIETHWSRPCGNPLSKYGWKPNARVRTCQEPSVSWFLIK